MVTFRGRHGHDGKALLIDGFEVLFGGNVVGFIWPDGILSLYAPKGSAENPNTLISMANIQVIRKKCAQVRKMPSKNGWIRVGKPAK